MSEYWLQGLYEIPVPGHGIERIYIKCMIRFAIQNGRDASKLIFPQKLDFSMKHSVL